MITEPPVERQCPKRTLRITVPARKRTSIRWASVRVDGQKLKLKRRRGRLVATLPAASITSDQVAVSIKVRYANGSRRTVSSTVATCA